MSSVLDASFLSRGTIASQLLPEARATLRSLLATRSRIVAPVLLEAEFASVLQKLGARGRLTRDDRVALWTDFEDLSIEFLWHPSWVRRAMAIAEAAGLSKVYDAIYLACAEAFGFELITCDARFARAAQPVTTAAIRLIEPR